MSIKHKGKLPYNHHGVPLNTDELAAFGAYIVRCGKMESNAAELVAALSDLREDFPDPAIIFTTGMLLRGKADLARKIARRAFPNNEAFVKEVEAYANAVEDMTELRNDLAHAQWIIGLFRDKTTDSIVGQGVGLHRGRHKSGFKDKLLEANVAELEKRIMQSVELEKEFHRLKERAIDLHQQRRAALRPNN